MLSRSLVATLLASSALALSVPDNVRAFYNELKAKGKCDNVLATGFYNSAFEPGGMFIVQLNCRSLTGVQTCPTVATTRTILD